MKKMIVIVSLFAISAYAMDNKEYTSEKKQSKPYIVSVESIFGRTCLVKYSNGKSRFEVRTSDDNSQLATFQRNKA